MKVFVLLLASALSFAAARPKVHGHGRYHLLKRDEGHVVIEYVLADGNTGTKITKEQAMKGLEEGIYTIAADGTPQLVQPPIKPQEVPPAPVEAPAPSPQPPAPVEAPAPAPQPPASEELPIKASIQAPVSEPEPEQELAPLVVASAPAYGPVSSSVAASAQGLYEDFPDGELDCSTFPSQYGALSLDYLGLGGWTGIQYCKGKGPQGYSDIETIVPDMCSGPDCCKEGAYCSYACPAGYDKDQWPVKQGETGQSIGGIQCRGGKLRLTNPERTKKLCYKPDDVTVEVTIENQLSTEVAACKTDYPGTESMTYPVVVSPGGEQPLFCPNNREHYVWNGNAHGSSSQYYLNFAGVPVEKACTWGKKSDKTGNFTPMNFGVGFEPKTKLAFVSLFANCPTVCANGSPLDGFKLDYTVEIQCDDCNGKCRYKDGMYCSGPNYENCNDAAGCTVAVRSGKVRYVLS